MEDKLQYTICHRHVHTEHQCYQWPQEPHQQTKQNKEPAENQEQIKLPHFIQSQQEEQIINTQPTPSHEINNEQNTPEHQNIEESIDKIMTVFFSQEQQKKDSSKSTI